MRDFEFSFKALDNFSNSLPYSDPSSIEVLLIDELNELKTKYNFPSIHNNIGSYIKFSINDWKPKNIFEMGSGYGHSAFWYLSSNCSSIENIFLTEKRSDLWESFENLSWPKEWKSKLDYYQGDAFDRLSQIASIDLCLIDGVKSDYLKFLTKVSSKMTTGGIVLIDNSYWRGSFLDPEIVLKKKSAQNIKELHDYIGASHEWDALFLPFLDGLSVLRKI
jgi:predicted O-methyltransferase YrrM